MKIIRPEQPRIKEEKHIKKEPQSIEDVMNEVLNGRKEYEITIRLNQSQYALWIKKGGEEWLKKVLIKKEKVKR